MYSFFRTSSLAVLLVLGLAIVFGACDNGDDTLVGDDENTPTTGEDVQDPTIPANGVTEGSEGGVAVEAVLDDFSIELAAMSAPAGSVSFNIANGGDLTHDFIVLTTDLDPGSLPQDATARVEIDGDTVTRVDGVEQIPTNEADTLTAELPQGDYVIICNVAGHYEQGMYTTFTAE